MRARSQNLATSFFLAGMRLADFTEGRKANSTKFRGAHQNSPRRRESELALCSSRGGHVAYVSGKEVTSMKVLRWTNFALGVWLVIAPFALLYRGIHAALWDDVSVGL